MTDVRVLILLVACCLFCHAASGEVKLSAIFSDGMVLQQGQKLPFWGTAEPGAKVTVAAANRRAETVADAQGRWRLTIGALDPGGPVAVTVDGGNTIEIRDVYVGEVWVCSGQSNMQFTLQAAKTAKEAIAGADFPRIRQFGGHAGEKWMVCSPKTAGRFSAVAFFFARELHKKRGVPVGILSAAVGGTPIRSWTSRAGYHGNHHLKVVELETWAHLALEPEAEIARWRRIAELAGEDPAKITLAAVRGKTGAEPGALYDRLIRPLTPFGVKGVVWYQGESDAWGFPIAQIYHEALPTLIADWRTAWGRDLPFLIVQLPNSPGVATTPPGQPSPWQVVQEAQALAGRVLPDVHTVVTLDLGENDIHPKRKAPVGERAARLARASVYGENIVGRGPRYKASRVGDGRVRIAFSNVGAGLVAKGGKRTGVIIAGADRYFFNARAEIEGNELVVWHESVPEPAAVRYAWTDRTPFNLYNKQGLPAGPFRTDNWSWDTPSRVTKSVPCLRVEQAPTIDGKLNEGLWEEVAAARDFTILHSYRPSAYQTEASFLFDEKHLYVGIRCTDPELDELVVKARGTDDKRIWLDDNVQLFLDVNRDRKSYVRFAFNAAGSVFDGNGYNDHWAGPRYHSLQLLQYGRFWNPRWHGELTVKTGRETAAWTVEVALPWSTLGLEAPPPAEMGLHLTRTHARSGERSEWNPTGRDRNTAAMLPHQFTGGCVQHHVVSRFGGLRIK